MKRANGLEIPESVEEAIDLDRTALLVYDMQVGILRQLQHGSDILTKVAEVLAVARESDFGHAFSVIRHFPRT
jgi:isochorismate hydrolase